MTAAGLFVSGTDTGIGKTLIACALADSLRRRGVSVGVMKPVETGHGGEGWPADADRLRRAAGSRDPREWVVPYVFAEPVAPWVASRRTGRPIVWDHVLAQAAKIQSAHSVVIVEGAGGLAVPITQDQTMVDLAVALGLPVVLVGASRLGTINHTVLSVAYARARGAEVVGIVLNYWEPDGDDPAQRDNPAVIEAMTGVPIWGTVPPLAAPDASWADVAAALDWSQMARALGWGDAPPSRPRREQASTTPG
jgi:dethiobiotin synthetase